MAISKVSDLNGLFNNIIDDSLAVLRADNLMVAGGLITLKNAEGYADRKIPEWNTGSVQTKAEGVDFTGHTRYEKTNAATITPAVSMSGFILTDEMRKTENEGDLQARAAMELGGALASDVDVQLMSLFTDFTASKGTANNALTLRHVAAAIALLINNKARGSKNVVLHPYGWHDIWIELGQPATNQAFLGESANDALREYAVTRLQGADWYSSPNVEVDGDTDAHSGVFTREAIIYDEREGYDMEPERDASLKAWELNASIGYGKGIQRQEAGVELIHDATEPT
jgi:hypothetical protein